MEGDSSHLLLGRHRRGVGLDVVVVVDAGRLARQLSHGVLQVIVSSW